jgi:hypothetical protein
MVRNIKHYLQLAFRVDVLLDARLYPRLGYSQVLERGCWVTSYEETGVRIIQRSGLLEEWGET